MDAIELLCAERKDLVTGLVIAESGHEAVEEQYFLPMVREVLPDGDELADQAIRQENEANNGCTTWTLRRPTNPISRP